MKSFVLQNCSGPIGALWLLALSSACSSSPEGGNRNASGGTNVVASGGSVASVGGSTSGGSNGVGGSVTAGGSVAAGGSAGSIAAGGSAGGDGSSGSSGDGGSAGSSTTYMPLECGEESSTELPENAPTLSTDSWTEISPPVFDQYPNGSGNFALTQGMTLDPCNPAVVYVCVPTSGSNVSEEGLWRSNDAGATWELVHNFGSCVNIRVDPEDPLHLYVGDGVAGGANGFFVSTDGGANFAMPQGFIDDANDGGTYDVYHVDVDPTDFDHLILTYHSGWDGGDSAVSESFNGGGSFTKSNLVGGAYAGGYNALFLYEPSLAIGNAQTWILGTQGKGYYRTTDSGTSWTKVSEVNMQHGGGTVYYSQEGVLYLSGDSGAILRSTNNGESFTTLQPSGNGSAAYLSVIGDGTHLYAGNHGGGSFFTALESDDDNWSTFNEQTFDEGPFQMAVDHANGIVYSANIRGGVWALKVGE